MRITIETSSWNNIQRIVAILKSLEISDFNIVRSGQMETFISKGDKSMDPHVLFGMWKDKPRDIEGIRRKAWK